MSTDKLQSAIQEMRDQLFLDTADGSRLNTVTSNLGLDRPLSGLSDDEWRAVAKNVALQPKQVTNAFHRIMEVCLGPRTARIANINLASLVGENIVQVEDATNLLQIGSLTFDPGQATEESVSFCFRDSGTHRIFLTSDLQFAHAEVDVAESNLVSTTLAGAGTLVLIDTGKFPALSPYSIIVDRGLESEELLVVSSNDTGTNTLTLAAVTTLDHLGPKSGFIRKAVTVETAVGRDFVVLDANDTRVMPSTGFIRFDFGGANEETVEYIENVLADDALITKRPLTSPHVVGESLELVSPGSLVETCSVVQTGVDWSIHETQAQKVKIFIPSNTQAFDARDASWMHDATQPAASDTLASPTLATDTEVTLVDSSGFPKVGMVLINGSITRFFTLNDTVTDKLTLTQEVGAIVPGSAAVDLILVPYIGTDLDEGNRRNSTGVVIPNRFPGPNVFDANQRAPSLTQTSLAETIPPPTTLTAPAVAGTTNVEVVEAFLLPAPPFTPFDVVVGVGTGFAETRTVTDRTLLGDASSTVDALAPIGSASIAGVDTTDFPESNGLDPAGYRIIIDRGGGNEETLTVDQVTPGTPGTISLVGVTTISHLATETVELLSDVLTLDALTNSHSGPSVTPTALGETVSKSVESIELSSAAALPNSGTVLVNFGKNRLSVRQRIVSIVSPTVIEVQNASKFPTTNFPYKMVVGDGLPTEELAFVAGVDTGLDEITFSAALVGTFVPGQYVEFTAGTPTELTYVDKDGDSIDLNVATTFDSVYTEGENVVLSPGASQSSVDGSAYAFLMPATAAACLGSLFDLVRAAGVEIEFLEDR